MAVFCRGSGIRRLRLFPSVLRPDFDAQGSDVEVLAEAEPGALDAVGFRSFGEGKELAKSQRRDDHFCSRLNPHIEAAVRREAVLADARGEGTG